MRGMNMRDMKARQLGRKGRVESRPIDPIAPQPVPTGLEIDIGEEDELDESMAAEVTVDQGDGMQVRRADRRTHYDDRQDYECPDAPPPGWPREEP